MKPTQQTATNIVILGSTGSIGTQTLDIAREYPEKFQAGDEAIADLAAMTEADTVVTAMVGYSGLVPTIHAIGAGKRIALANKETLVVAGELITGLLKNSESEIIPVDIQRFFNVL